MLFSGLQLPEEWAARLGIREIRYLASGDDSDTFLCDYQYVIKAPKRETVRQAQQREFQLYDFLSRQRLSFQTPKAIYQGESYMIISFIQGSRLTYKEYGLLSRQEQEALAYDEAAFLRELHSLQVDEAEPFFLSAQQDKRRQYELDYERLCRILTEAGEMTQKLKSKIGNMYARIFQTGFLFQYTPCLTHNDFSAGNMVFQDKRLRGVIDFGDFVIGDPDNDFLYLLDSSTDDFGKEFGRRVLYHYGHSAPGIAERKAEINDAYWPLQQILLGADRGEGPLIQKGIQEFSEMKLPAWRI